MGLKVAPDRTRELESEGRDLSKPPGEGHFAAPGTILEALKSPRPSTDTPALAASPTLPPGVASRSTPRPAPRLRLCRLCAEEEQWEAVAPGALRGAVGERRPRGALHGRDCGPGGEWGSLGTSFVLSASRAGGQLAPGPAGWGQEDSTGCRQPGLPVLIWKGEGVTWGVCELGTAGTSQEPLRGLEQWV